MSSERVAKEKMTILGRLGGGKAVVLYSAPALVFYTLFMIFPIVFSLYISFQSWSGGPMEFIGAANYVDVLTDPDFWITFKNTIVLLVLSVLIQVPVAFLLAYLLFRSQRVMGVFRAIYFMPSAISSTVIGVLFCLMLNSDLGPINFLLRKAGLSFLALNWLSNKDTVLYATCAVMIWQFIGYHMVIILAGMQSIPVELLEAAAIDGASSGRILSSVVLPLCRDMIEICMILAVVGSFKSFDVPYVMTWGGPGVSSSFLAIYMFKAAFLKSEIGLGTTIGIIILLLALIGTRVINRVFEAKDD